MKLVSKVDVDKLVVVNFAKMSKNILDKAPKSALKDTCLTALDASETEGGGRRAYLVIGGCGVRQRFGGCWTEDDRGQRGTGRWERSRRRGGWRGWGVPPS